MGGVLRCLLDGPQRKHSDKRNPRAENQPFSGDGTAIIPEE